MKSNRLFSFTIVLFLLFQLGREETMPSYPGGTEALIKFVAGNISYPTEASKAGIEGKVFVSFDVSKKGKVENVRVVKGIGAGCDAEAMRVVKLLEGWKPGTKDGKAVRTQVTLPIIFALDKKKDETPADMQPSYPGGMEALAKVLGENMKYPEEAHDKGIEGKVFVSMMVMEDGSLANVEVVKGIGAGCDAEAMRIIKLTGRWNPGKQAGNVTPMKIVLPVTFSMSH